ncbi:hypothetical protein I315_00187 [Cryptococcus gattii Ru294]|nr:hypothetical protein I315_00187 [Cryptococcus gattii Ru294]
MTKGGTPARYYIKEDRLKYDTNAKQPQYTNNAQCIIVGEYDRRKPQTCDSLSIACFLLPSAFWHPSLVDLVE